MKHAYNIIAAAVGAACGFLWGELDGMLIALLVFIVLDYVSGCLSAAKNKRLSSSVGLMGILKKVGILIAVAVAHILDVYVIHMSGVLMTMTELFMIANEGLSILENLGEIGVKLPKALKETLAKLRDNNDDNKDNDKGDQNNVSQS